MYIVNRRKGSETRTRKGDGDHRCSDQQWAGTGQVQTRDFLKKRMAAHGMSVEENTERTVKYCPEKQKGRASAQAEGQG